MLEKFQPYNGKGHGPPASFAIIKDTGRKAIFGQERNQSSQIAENTSRDEAFFQSIPNYCVVSPITPTFFNCEPCLGETSNFYASSEPVGYSSKLHLIFSRLQNTLCSLITWIPCKRGNWRRNLDIFFPSDGPSSYWKPKNPGLKSTWTAPWNVGSESEKKWNACSSWLVRNPTNRATQLTFWRKR